MITVFIKNFELYSEPLRYLIKLIEKTIRNKFTEVTNKENASYIFDHTDYRSIKINLHFYNLLLIKKRYKFTEYFDKEPIIYFTDSNKKDWLSSIFYLVNCFQEYDIDNDDKYDEFGRFKFEKSLQFKFNCIEENLVQKYILEFCKSELNISLNNICLPKTRVFLTHDVDSVNGSFLQDGFWALKRGRFDIVLKLIFEKILHQPGWKNIDYINSLHDEKGLISTFFWLATNEIGEYGVKNSDYTYGELQKLSRSSISNGLHKSSSSKDIDTELKMLPFQTQINRYHFLMFKLPTLWERIQESNLKLDASLGFAERFGFRNNYGLPFKPYNINSGKSYDFIEVPLNIMDGTFQKYLNIPTEKTASVIIDFIEKNKNNSLLSILWHNTFFTNYKYNGYLSEYKKILLYLVESKISSTSPELLISDYDD